MIPIPTRISSVSSIAKSSRWRNIGARLVPNGICIFIDLSFGREALAKVGERRRWARLQRVPVSSDWS